MANRKLEYTLQGETFKLRPTSRKVSRELDTYITSLQEDMEKVTGALKAKAAGEDVESDDLPEIPDQFEIALEVFKIITVGPHDILDVDEFDYHVAQEAAENFNIGGKKMI